ncbi:MAG TPA: hypothetical protein VG753_01475 [Candidatus Paceibacterota bacterium]|nr:hypothetical protein [Candidatus Paceibacterota bacterium]
MRRFLLLLAAILILSYGLFEARRLIGGPEITIDSPQDGSATSTELIAITGTAQNISFLTINDAPAFTDESGRFAVKLSAPPGYAIFTVAATDRFGRRASAQVHITVLNYCAVR